jgi:hypothetical protein
MPRKNKTKKDYKVLDFDAHGEELTKGYIANLIRDNRSSKKKAKDHAYKIIELEGC